MLPKSYYVRRSDIVRATGVSSTQLDKLIRAGVIKRVVLPGCKYGKYIRSQVKKALNLEE